MRMAEADPRHLGVRAQAMGWRGRPHRLAIDSPSVVLHAMVSGTSSYGPMGIRRRRKLLEKVVTRCYLDGTRQVDLILDVGG